MASVQAAQCLQRQLQIQLEESHAVQLREAMRLDGDYDDEKPRDRIVKSDCLHDSAHPYLVLEQMVAMQWVWRWNAML